MGEDNIHTTVRTVYQKDLYSDTFTVNTRIDTDKLEDGDQLKVEVSKIGNAHNIQGSKRGKEKDLRGARFYKISKVVNGFVKWIRRRVRWFKN